MDTSSSIDSAVLKPYLELPHLLSLTWLAYPILSLLFVAFRLYMSHTSAQNSLDNAKDSLNEACRAAEHAATSAASLPRYMALGTNEQFVHAVNGTFNGVREALNLSLTIMEAIINFIVDMYRSTLLCFIELIVRAALGIVIDALQEISKGVTAAADGIRDAIQDSVKVLNDAISGVMNIVKKVPFIGDVSTPQFNVPDLTALTNVTLPPDWLAGLQKLNDSLPDMETLKKDMDNLIDTPFELLKKDINDTFANIQFNSSILPIPQTNSVTFCQDADVTSLVDDLAKAFTKIMQIGLIVVLLAALLLILGMCFLEWYKWRSSVQHLQRTREAWRADPTMAAFNKASAAGRGNAPPTVVMSDHNLRMLAADGEHPLLTRIAFGAARMLRLSPEAHSRFRWFLHYIFHHAALACFLIGLFGLISVELQLLAARPLYNEFHTKAVGASNNFQSTIANSINASMYNQSASYADGVNAQVAIVQSSINDGVFGWVNTTTTTLNDTIATFYADVQNTVTTFFGGTILESPVSEFIKCFIGSKVDAMEHALTFLHDNLQVNIPTMNQSALVLSPDYINEASQPIANAAIGGTNDGNDDGGGLTGKLLNAYIKSIEEERIMFCVFLGLWFIVVLMGLGIVLWNIFVTPWKERRERALWMKEQRGGFGSSNDHLQPYDLEKNPALAPDVAFGQEKTSSESVRPYSPLPPPPPRAGMTQRGSLHSSLYADAYAANAYMDQHDSGRGGIETPRRMSVAPARQQPQEQPQQQSAFDHSASPLPTQGFFSKLFNRKTSAGLDGDRRRNTIKLDDPSTAMAPASHIDDDGTMVNAPPARFSKHYPPTAVPLIGGGPPMGPRYMAVHTPGSESGGFTTPYNNAFASRSAEEPLSPPGLEHYAPQTSFAPHLGWSQPELPPTPPAAGEIPAPLFKDIPVVSKPLQRAPSRSVDARGQLVPALKRGPMNPMSPPPHPSMNPRADENPFSPTSFYVASPTTATHGPFATPFDDVHEEQPHEQQPSSSNSSPNSSPRRRPVPF